MLDLEPQLKARRDARMREAAAERLRKAAERHPLVQRLVRCPPRQHRLGLVPPQ